ncbi:hypothetical protein Tco_0547645 [Tanacetum coccineum]
MDHEIGTRNEEDGTVTQDHIEDFQVDDIPTQQSKVSDTGKMIKDVIATRKLKSVSLKKRCKSERIAKRGSKLASPKLTFES